MRRSRNLFLRKTIVAASFAALLAVAWPPVGTAQESNSKPNNIGTPPAATTAGATPLTGPSLALRQALAAACRQDETEFTKFLTTRNAETFSTLTARRSCRADETVRAAE